MKDLFSKERMGKKMEEKIIGKKKNSEIDHFDIIKKHIFLPHICFFVDFELGFKFQSKFIIS